MIDIVVIHRCLYVNKQLKPAYTECRAANGQCDLAEYCNGTDPLCPSDVYRRNTDSCTVNGVRLLQCVVPQQTKDILNYHLVWENIFSSIVSTSACTCTCLSEFIQDNLVNSNSLLEKLYVRIDIVQHENSPFVRICLWSSSFFFFFLFFKLLLLFHILPLLTPTTRISLLFLLTVSTLVEELNVYWQVLSHCYNGECRTHQSQCRLWFGDSFDNSPIDKGADDCYTRYNVVGRRGGNCGYDHKTKSYLKCSLRYAWYVY